MFASSTALLSIEFMVRNTPSLTHPSLIQKTYTLFHKRNAQPLETYTLHPGLNWTQHRDCLATTSDNIRWGRGKENVPRYDIYVSHHHQIMTTYIHTPRDTPPLPCRTNFGPSTKKKSLKVWEYLFTGIYVKYSLRGKKRTAYSRSIYCADMRLYMSHQNGLGPFLGSPGDSYAVISHNGKRSKSRRIISVTLRTCSRPRCPSGPKKKLIYTGRFGKWRR